MTTLTPREVTVICLVAKGFTDSEVAGEMSVQSVTVRSHISHVRCKLGFPLRKRRGPYDLNDKADRVKLAIYALQQGHIALKDIPAIGGN